MVQWAGFGLVGARLECWLGLRGLPSLMAKNPRFSFKCLRPVTQRSLGKSCPPRRQAPCGNTGTIVLIVGLCCADHFGRPPPRAAGEKREV